jgi:hypothetical protein
VKENLKSRETRKVLARVDRKEIVYINHIIESYDGVMIMTTVYPEEARVEFNISPYLYEEAEQILCALSKETSLKIIEKDENIVHE